MDRRNNPYAPGAGLQPPELAGRDRLLADASIDMDRVLAGRPAKGLILLGLRGVGKTVLLNRLRSTANEKGFRTARIEAPEGSFLPQLLVPELRQLLYGLDLRQAATDRLLRAANLVAKFAAVFKVKAGDLEFSVDLAPGEGDSGNLEQDLPQLLVALAEAAAERRTAIGLFIDEVQYLSPTELGAVVVACHEIAQQNLPFLFVGAGLPQVAALAGRAKSYAERLFDYPQLGPLEAEDARAALLKPAQAEGVVFDDGATRLILDAAENFPYFIQEWGFQVWNAAPASPITTAMARAASPDVVAHLDNNFFRVRFDRLTPLEQKYLRAMAELGSGPHATGRIAETLGVRPSAVATVRRHLIDKGMVWSQRHGETSFTVPMFDAFMKRQMPELLKHIPQSRGR
ncbi:MAG: AAA family ATPase [Gammaproteobacteria bacterium]|nr:AAA family ATPase [Gammaproteobacteria bacterium]MXW44867.1 AAA family ATPase [Gammaproteobacteria bacterium]MYD02006.1 AAA family ATPase [Gammaproteobacteria bacterium]MYI24063.1 AAA family ATPase [Gammaproteobacteria bacterium]